MGTDHAVSTNDYLQSTELVLLAGKQLRKMLDAEPSTLEYYVTGLERAAQQHETGGNSYRGYMLNSLEAPQAQPQAVLNRVTQDTLASISADLQVANVLMAAGQILGETGAKAEPSLLDSALGGLESSTQVLEPSLLTPLDAAPAAGRFSLAAALPAAPLFHSNNLGDAVKCFGDTSSQTLTDLVKGAQDALSSAITALSKIDQQKVMEALSKLGAQVQDLPKIGRLFAQGVQKLEEAIDSLIRLLGSQALVQVKAQVEQVWTSVKQGQYVTDGLHYAFATQAAQDYVKGILEKQGLDIVRLDDASNRLLQLQAQFKDSMQTLGGITSALTLASSFIAFTSLVTPQLALGMAAAYLVVISAVLLIGMDYADSTTILNRVAGVREIAKSVAD